ncbi:MAG: hypothetical protein FNT29_10325 [Halothiobacillaceae bacterium]|nr:MAG: hypothetical protein FNT29_10325 [Halothiobacillaceae bacterium]
MIAARIYLVTVGDATHLVKATSQAQAIRRIARDLMTCRPAHSLEVAGLMMAGATVLDAADPEHERQEAAA